MDSAARNRYAEYAVTLDRIRRRQQQAEREWQLWLGRVALATRLGERQLAAQARRRALKAAERAVGLRAYLDTEEPKLRELAAALA